MTQNRISRRKYAGFLTGSLVGVGVATGQTTAQETVGIRHSRTSRSTSTTSSSQGASSARELINITPDEDTDRIEFGGDTNRVFALIDDATGREVTFTPDPGAETASSSRIRFRTEPDAFEQEDPTITAFTPDREVVTVDIAGSYSGDLDMLSTAPVHSITVELRQEDGSVLATTDSRFVATGYEYTSSIKDTMLRVTRADAVDPNWTVEFTLTEDGEDRETAATVDVANEANADMFEIDLSAIDVPSGEYYWSITISAEANKPATAAVVDLRGVDPIDPTDPTPTTVTISGQLSGAFDPDVGAVRAYTSSEITTRPDSEGGFSLDVPTDESFSLAYIEIDPETDDLIIENGVPDIHLLRFIDDPLAVDDLGTFTVPDGYQLDVTITDAAGDPAADVRTWVQSYNPDTGGWVGLVTSTNEEGKFQFGENDPGIEMGGPVKITVEADDDDDRIPDVPPFEILDVTQPESVTLQLDSVTVSGQLEASDLSETLMYALNEDTFQTTSLSDSGGYEFTMQRNQSATLGAYQIDSDNIFGSRNGVADIYAVEEITPQSPTTISPVTIPDGDVVEIRVEDQNGEPIPGSLVTLRHHRNDASTPLSRPVNDDGEFQLGGAPPGIELTGEIDIEVAGPSQSEFADDEATERLTVSGPESLTVTLGDSETPTVGDYAGPDGVVGSSGLQDAFGDWTANEIPAAVLQSVFSAWQSGSTVDTTTVPSQSRQLDSQTAQGGPTVVDPTASYPTGMDDTDAGSRQ